MESFFTLFGLSFMLALTGALQPGPLLTYTIQTTLNTPRRGWLTGPRVIAGHAALELTLVFVFFLVIGLADFFRQETTVRVIGVAGTAVILFFVVLTLRDVFHKKVDLPGAGSEAVPQRGLRANPYLGGIIISMSNPFWWVWWAITGFAILSQQRISFANPLPFLGFFLGHQAADLAWYSLVSIMFHTGRRWLTQKIYHGILVTTAAFMTGFAVYIAVNAFLYRTPA